MIKGVGIDLIEVERVANVLERRRRRFLKRVFTPREIEECGQAVHRLAGRFAAKEALLKALGTGLRGLKWRDIEVNNNELGAPYFHFSEQLALYLQEAGVKRTHLTISHSKNYAVAQVILEG
ncbi:MAG: holo-ACP synthase [Firmicutes bacterium]|nr:holo-ACP synthase [Bacillota bacterium]